MPLVIYVAKKHSSGSAIMAFCHNLFDWQAAIGLCHCLPDYCTENEIRLTDSRSIILVRQYTIEKSSCWTRRADNERKRRIVIVAKCLYLRLSIERGVHSLLQWKQLVDLHACRLLPCADISLNVFVDVSLTNEFCVQIQRLFERWKAFVRERNVCSIFLKRTIT